MVLKAEMQSRGAEPSNFYSSPLIQAEEDKKVVNLRHSCPITQSEGAKTFVTGVYSYYCLTGAALNRLPRRLISCQHLFDVPFSLSAMIQQRPL